MEDIREKMKSNIQRKQQNTIIRMSEVKLKIEKLGNELLELEKSYKKNSENLARIEKGVTPGPRKLEDGERLERLKKAQEVLSKDSPIAGQVQRTSAFGSSR